MRWIWLLLLSGMALAAETVPAPLISDAEWNAAQGAATKVATGSPVGTGTVVTMVVGVLAVVALAVLLGWLAKRMGVAKALGGRGRNLQVVETVTLAPKRQLALVRLGDQLLVVGLGEREVSHIATMPATAIAAPVAPVATPAEGAAPPPAAPTPENSAFRATLDRLIGRQP
jgi:flagellar protein FliO/FliZ